MPLTLLVVAAVAAAVLLWRLAVARSGGRRVLLVVAGCSLGVCLPVAVAAVSVPVTWHGVICGSAASASLERGVPDDSALDAAQAGCKARGAAVVHAATATGAVAVGLGALAVLGAAVPSRRSPAYA
jgi:hypothetical protein